jgi:hypothetical protein
MYMAKYQPLTGHLNRVKGDRHPLTFAEIETIIGGRLPASAYRYRAWWSNNPENSVMTKAWLAAGWYSSDVDMEGKKLVFRRGAEAGPGFQEERAQDALGERIGVRIPQGAADTLRVKADLEGRTLEQLAAEILVGQARLSTQERLAMADRVRSNSPKLHQLDIPNMIREDRDRR